MNQIPKWSEVKAVIVDSDGVLTDGGVHISDTGEQSRRFSIKDGAGIVALENAGIPFAIVSSSSCKAVEYRANQLGVTEVHTGIKDKKKCVADILQNWNISPLHALYVGDDLIDLEVMSGVGYPCAVRDAIQAVREAAIYITTANGGQGAVREIVDLILEHVQDENFDRNTIPSK
jgi:3-deoxy-D-manno-octulosonate 8-phosphate phosphatase (KDO 8-P phosphatase)